jgi:outer membrane protein TolC
MQECSKYRVSVAWAKYIPVFNLGLTTPDPVSSDKKKEYYGIFGFTTPILDWGERSREVDRAMLTQKVDALDAQNTRREFDVQYIQARQDFELYAAEDEYAFSNDELTVLQYKKNKILYESGIVALPKLLESYADTYNSKIELNKIHLLRNIVYLGLKRMSGKLFNELIGEVDYDVQ